MEKIRDVISNKSLKPSERVSVLNQIIENDLTLFLDEMSQLRPVDSARAMEALELYTRTNSVAEIERVHDLVSKGIMQSNNALVRESCRVIANIASADLNYDSIAARLLELTEHAGTVIRWAAATALVSLAENHPSLRLQEVFDSIAAREEKNSIRKIYLRLKKK